MKKRLTQSLMKSFIMYRTLRKLNQMLRKINRMLRKFNLMPMKDLLSNEFYCIRAAQYTRFTITLRKGQGEVPAEKYTHYISCLICQVKRAGAVALGVRRCSGSFQPPEEFNIE